MVVVGGGGGLYISAVFGQTMVKSFAKPVDQSTSRARWCPETSGVAGSVPIHVRPWRTFLSQGRRLLP